MGEEQRKAALTAAKDSINSMRRELDALMSARLYGGGLTSKNAAAFAEAAAKIREGKESAKELQEAVYAAFNETGDGKLKDALLAIIDRLAHARTNAKELSGESDNMNAALGATSEKLSIASQSAATYAANLRGVSGALRLVSEYGDQFRPPTLNIDAGAIAEERRKTQLDTYIKGLSDTQRSVAAALSNAYKLNQGQISRALSGDFSWEFDPAKRRGLEGHVQDLMKNAEVSERNKSGGGGASSAFKVAEAYEKAVDAAEQLRLKNEELRYQLAGNSEAASQVKIERKYQAKLDAMEKRERELENNRAAYAKAGKLETHAAALREIETQKQLLEENKALNEEIARRAQLERDARAAADYYGMIGDLAGVYQAEVDLLKVKQLSVATDMERAALAEQIRVAEARRDLNIPELLKTGYLQQSKQAWQDYVNFFENDVPGAFAST